MYRAVCLLFATLFLANTSNGKTIHGHLYCPCSPGTVTSPAETSGAYALLKKGLTYLDKKLTEPHHIGFSRFKTSRELFENCEKEFSRKECINSDSMLRKKSSGVSRPLCTYDSATQKNLDANENPVADCADNIIKVLKKKVGEGCVAVEHLVGLKLQYKRNFRANVLCSSDLRGTGNSQPNWKFCATPNHGIFVHGTYKSMKSFCSEAGPSCTFEVRLVNNIRVFAHTAAHVNEHVVVTPYDFRYPWWIAYIVQGIQEVLWMMYLSVGIFFAVAISWALHYAIMSN